MKPSLIARTTVVSLIVGLTFGAAGCGKKSAGSSDDPQPAVDSDPAKEEYERCLAKEKAGDLAKAVYYCASAAKLHPDTKAGKAAGAKSAEIQVKLDALDKVENDNRAEAAKAATAAAAAEVEALKRKVNCPIMIGNDGNNANETCLNKGLPSVYRECKGGTFNENEKVAVSMGCEHAHPLIVPPPDYRFNMYCCSK